MKKDMTIPSDEIISITKKFSQNKYKAIFESVLWIKNNLEKIDYNRNIFRKRDASEIVKSREVMGCSDIALVFISFMRALDIKASYMETISEGTLVDLIKYPNKKDIPVAGHIFVRVEIDDIPMIVDPTASQILLRSDLPAPSMFPDSVLIGEGKDFVSLDIDSVDKIRKHTKEFIRKVVK